ncbi:putative teichuronic acid biosynthesis glycosyltransferase TuaH [invertebrate metagenome]|uniref:Putative teichuronic acid biosynthesis glycosyltransferase TuaH n=1 Tax=invertebrate metagenome TaxID=1711999 RepID=A0A2H9TCE4_9ZZZZ
MVDLVVFGEDWIGHPSATQHLIKGLLPRHRVIWVNSIGLRAPRMNGYDLRRMMQKLRDFCCKNTADTTEKNLTVLYPLVIPLYGLKWVRRINHWLLVRQIRRCIRQQQFFRYILWTSLPTSVDVMGDLNAVKCLYYCGDDFSALDGVAYSPVVVCEQYLAAKVDLVVVPGEQLAKRFNGCPLMILPHGVNYPLFSFPQARPDDLPREGPVAGFYGSLSAWLDIDLLIQTATALPKWQFVFIGPVKTSLSGLEALPNVHILPPKRHGQLPAYVQNWDVSLLPFRNNLQIKSCNPLKLKEYLASGTPVASTTFHAVKAYSNEVVLQQPREPFYRVIQRAYLFGGDADKRQRQQAVEKESWRSRSQWLSQLFLEWETENTCN